MLLAMTLLPAACAGADYVVHELGKEDGEPGSHVVPYGFSSEAMGFIAVVAGGISGLPQEQLPSRLSILGQDPKEPLANLRN